MQSRSLSLSLTVSPNIEMISSIPIGSFQALCERAHCVFFFVCTNRTSCTISDSAHVEKLLRRAKRRKTIVGRVVSVVSVVRFRFSPSPPSRALSFVKEEKNVSRGEAIKEIVKKFSSQTCEFSCCLKVERKHEEDFDET